ncbi:META and DUF4377 domain-containing protein [Silvimonas iriomotensis]|uniref:Heat shock protein HslJ n=1 Tax=Silvimonas iriomotensis TaxID=449662 RepID=A0ABQ2P574_9NEIS|nr:META and DUF4377 domain-containing protein [Silvimonas iriomotensis]GGP18622.1 hypothetical protein GCM10010970_05990 [Silvimonas iriomotensis]
MRIRTFFQTALLAGMFAATAVAAQARSLLDGEYQLQSWRVAGQTQTEQAKNPVTLKIDGNHVSGFSGCNRFMGQIQTLNGLKIGPLAGTRMACLDASVGVKESDVLKLLDTARYYELDTAGHLTFTTPNEDLLVFVRTDGKAPAAAAAPATTGGEKVIQVAPDTVTCSAGAGQMQCLQVRDSADQPWTLLYGGIDGFTWQQGTLYTLRIKETPVDNPPADGSSIKRSLVRVLTTLVIQ